MTHLPSTPGDSAPARANIARRLTNAQLRIIRLSVARTCTDAEFDHFMSVADRTGLDPLRGQISALVRSPWDPDKRTMVPFATIDGLRAIAARHGDYRPMEGAPLLETDPERREAQSNPLGLVRAEVTLWRKFDDNWFPITGEAWWDEYAVLVALPKANGEANERAAARDSAGAAQRMVTLTARWRQRGRVLLAKCAEAQALRRGWPEDLSGLYGEEELQRAEVDDLLAHERAAHAAEDIRQRALAGSRSLALSFQAGEPFEQVGRDQLGQRLGAFIAAATSATEIESFQLRNREALRTFWEWSPGEALEVKRHVDRTLASLNGTPNHEAPSSESSDRQTRTSGGNGRRRARQQVSTAANQGDQDPAA